MEATGVSHQTENPGGVAFLHAEASDPTGLPARVTPLVKKALADLRSDLAGAGMDGKDVLKAACFVSSLEDYAEARRVVATEFPRAVLNFVQPLRAPLYGLAQCEIVARIRGSDREAQAGGAAMVRARRVVLSGDQIAFGFREEDARLAFQRLGKVLGENGTSLRQAAWLSIYALSAKMGEQARRIGGQFLDGGQPPAGGVLVCEDLPALDASFAVDVVAVLEDRP
jgi:enamine deaminase RidA (YjgF/YER057c/UK114 family)